MLSNLNPHVPYGYSLSGDALVINEKEAPIRALMYDLFLELKNIRAVAKELNKRGFRTRNSSLWSDVSVSRLLSDTTAKGVRITNHTKAQKDKKSWDFKDEKDWVKSPCPTIVSVEIWNEVNKYLLENSGGAGRPARYLFTGKVFCSCGQKMYGRYKAVQYMCKSCSVKISESDLEEIFSAEINVDFLSQSLAEKREIVSKHLSSLQIKNDEIELFLLPNPLP